MVTKMQHLTAQSDLVGMLMNSVPHRPTTTTVLKVVGPDQGGDWARTGQAVTGQHWWLQIHIPLPQV